MQSEIRMFLIKNTDSSFMESMMCDRICETPITNVCLVTVSTNICYDHHTAVFVPT